MSLQVWLPLTGRDRGNQGLNSTYINVNADLVSGGKLGDCCKTNSTASTDLQYNGNQVNYTSLSFGGWFKFNKTEIASAISNKTYTSTASTATGNLIGNNSYGGVSLQWWSNNIYVDGNFTQLAVQSYLRTSTNGARSTGTTAIPFDTWTHIFLTYDKDNNLLSYYVNGELKSSSVQATFTDAPSRNLMLNYGAVAGGNGPSAMIPFSVNDVRIYDHCLSLLEVKELAKGLVIHYPLNRDGFGNTNILTNTHFDSRYSQTTGWDTTKNGTLLANAWNGYNSGVTNPSTVYHAHLKKYQDQYVYEYIKTNNENWLGIAQSGLQSRITAGLTYTFSWEQYCVEGSNYTATGLYYYKTGATSAAFHLGLQYGNTNRQLGKWQKFSYTFVAPNDADYTKNMSWYIYGHYGGNGTFYIRHPKLEEGSKATPWTPYLSDFMASWMNIDDFIEHDNSGLLYNGARTGTFTYTSDTPKYHVSTYFSGSNWITSGAGSLSWYTFDEGTLAGWIKPTTAPSSWGGSFGIGHDSVDGYYSKIFSIANQNGGKFQINSTTGSTWVIIDSGYVMPVNEWHHYVATLENGTTVKMYVDGELVHTGTINYGTAHTASDTLLEVAIDLPGGDEKYVGYYSDIRFYATALSAEDIQELYKHRNYN